MKGRKKSNQIDIVVDESSLIPVNSKNELVRDAIGIFKDLTVEDQDEFVRQMISDGGLERFIRILQDSESPGIADIITDSVTYVSFLPIIKQVQQ